MTMRGLIDIKSWIIHAKGLLIKASEPCIYGTRHMLHLQLLHVLSLKFEKENFKIMPIFI